MTCAPRPYYAYTGFSICLPLGLPWLYILYILALSKPTLSHCSACAPLHHSISPPLLQVYISYSSNQPSTLTQELGRGTSKVSETDQWPLKSSIVSMVAVYQALQTPGASARGEFPERHYASEAGDLKGLTCRPQFP